MERPSFWRLPHRESKSYESTKYTINTNVSPTKSVSFHPSVFENEKVSSKK